MGLAENYIPKFNCYQQVLHLKTNTLYVITNTPTSGFRIESTNTPAYTYTQLNQANPIVWVRGYDEMEDGRFVELTV